MRPQHLGVAACALIAEADVLKTLDVLFRYGARADDSGMMPPLILAAQQCTPAVVKRLAEANDAVLADAAVRREARLLSSHVTSTSASPIPAARRTTSRSAAEATPCRRAEGRT